MRILGSRMSSFNSFSKIVVKPLSKANHLHKNLFQILTLIAYFEFLRFPLQNKFTLVDKSNTVTEIFDFKHIVTTQQNSYAVFLNIALNDFADMISMHYV